MTLDQVDEPDVLMDKGPSFPEDLDPLALEQQVCFALAVASRGVIGVYRPILDRLHLTHPQYLVMLALWQHAPLKVTDLAQLLQLEPATLSPLLKRLEAIGYVVRERDRSDERALRITLTGEGRDLREQALAIPGTVMERLDLTLGDVRALHGTLTEVIRRVEGAPEHPQPDGARRVQGRRGPRH